MYKKLIITLHKAIRSLKPTVRFIYIEAELVLNSPLPEKCLIKYLIETRLNARVVID